MFKKKPYKWAAKINETVGAQNLNLHLGQIKIDEIELTNFINQLNKENKEERKKLIKAFKVNRTNFSVSGLQKITVYVLIAIALLFLSLSSFVAVMTVMIAMGIAAITTRWRPDNLTVRKYAGIATWLGLVNMVLCLETIKIYNNITEEVGEQLTIEIEEYKEQNATFPTDIKSIDEKLDLNLFERYFANTVEYTATENDYELEANMLLGKRRKYDKGKANGNKYKR